MLTKTSGVLILSAALLASAPAFAAQVEEPIEFSTAVVGAGAHWGEITGTPPEPGYLAEPGNLEPMSIYDGDAAYAPPLTVHLGRHHVM
jgi:hypothetical protein